MITVGKPIKIRDFYGRIIATTEIDKDGNMQIRDFYGRILGFYDKGTNKTRDFYGRIIGNGNLLSLLIENK